MKYLLVAVFTGLTFLKGFSQTKKVVADKIVGQVGDKIILYSDVVNAIADYKRQGQEGALPPNPECAFLEGQLIQKALVLQAEKDSLIVSDEEVEAAIDNQLRYFIQQYGSKEMLEEVSGKTIYQIKDEFRLPFKEKKMAEQMKNKIVDNIRITPNEVKIYFNKIPKDSLPFYESELEISQIVLIPKAHKSVEEYVIKQLYDYKRQAENGVRKFEVLAKQFSEDPGSKDNGGQYSINRNEKYWDKDFMAAAFRLKEGQISNVIKSKFGYHIIQMVSRAGDDAIIRHILRIPPVTEDEINIAKVKLDSVRSEILKGNISFSKAVDKYTDDENSKYTGGAITSRNTGSTYLTLDELDKDIIVAIKNLKVGDYSKAVSFEEQGVKKVRIIHLKTRTEPHRENLREDYNKVAARALEEKKQAVLEKWFKEHLPNYYITIDKEFADCSSLGDWWKFAVNR